MIYGAILALLLIACTIFSVEMYPFDLRKKRVTMQTIIMIMSDNLSIDLQLIRLFIKAMGTFNNIVRSSLCFEEYRVYI